MKSRIKFMHMHIFFYVYKLQKVGASNNENKV